jgi:hypothetical protein
MFSMRVLLLLLYLLIFLTSSIDAAPFPGLYYCGTITLSESQLQLFYTCNTKSTTLLLSHQFPLRQLSSSENVINILNIQIHPSSLPTNLAPNKVLEWPYPLSTSKLMFLSSHPEQQQKSVHNPSKPQPAASTLLLPQLLEEEQPQSNGATHQCQRLLEGKFGHEYEGYNDILVVGLVILFLIVWVLMEIAWALYERYAHFYHPNVRKVKILILIFWNTGLKHSTEERLVAAQEIYNINFMAKVRDLLR